ncbi:ADP-ribosylglycohydrolase family protein [Curtobacterium sp. S6]|uniref:ADP-ribosylglycohydrolase family protein n=1 Tax=Curtobacterium sp. S6 TaxID=1479623 RepID=UPI0004ABC183|nr:ADP-ribosylglycohydrolase family protein [Curtobacterium sp. S6]
MSVHGGDLPHLDPHEHGYADILRRVLIPATAVEPRLALGPTATLAGLSEVLSWALRGQGADETASVWIENLRWARCLGLRLDEGAPVPPTARWEPTAPQARGCGIDDADAATREALPKAQMQYPARHDLPWADSAAFLPRLVPVALFPVDSLAHVGQLAVNITALTHGSPEALATGMTWTLLLRSLLGARDDAASDEQLILDGCSRCLDLMPPAGSPGGPQGLRSQYAAMGGSLTGLGAIYAAAPRTVAMLRDVVGLEPLAEDPAATGGPACVEVLRRALTALLGEEGEPPRRDAAFGLGHVLRGALGHETAGAEDAASDPSAIDSLTLVWNQWLGLVRDWEPAAS